MITIVSGFPRSGTSMMMQCLYQGGVMPYVDNEREEYVSKLNRKDYVVNPRFHEVGSQNYMRLGFSTEVPNGRAVKIQAKGLCHLSPGTDYKIIFMRREPADIRESFEVAFPQDNFDKNFPDWPGYYWHLMEGVKATMGMRRDVELLELWYEKVVADPLGAMNRVAAMGVPINPEKAASVVDPELMRYGKTA